MRTKKTTKQEDMEDNLQLGHSNSVKQNELSMVSFSRDVVGDATLCKLVVDWRSVLKSCQVFVGSV